jgi:hypothetical protein
LTAINAQLLIDGRPSIKPIEDENSLSAIARVFFRVMTAAPALRRVAGSINRTSAIRLASPESIRMRVSLRRRGEWVIRKPVPLNSQQPFDRARLKRGALRTGLKMPLPSVMGILQRIRGAVEVLKYMSERARIDLDAILANLALEEGEEKLPQVVDSIPLDPEMLSEIA